MFLVGFVLLCLSALYHMKKSLNFDGLSGREKIWQHFPINCYKMATHMKHLTYLLNRKISTPLLSANKISSANVLKLEVTGNFGYIRDSTNKVNRQPQSVRV